MPDGERSATRTEDQSIVDAQVNRTSIFAFGRSTEDRPAASGVLPNLVVSTETVFSRRERTRSTTTPSRPGCGHRESVGATRWARPLHSARRLVDSRALSTEFIQHSGVAPAAAVNVAPLPAISTYACCFSNGHTGRRRRWRHQREDIPRFFSIFGRNPEGATSIMSVIAPTRPRGSTAGGTLPPVRRR